MLRFYLEAKEEFLEDFKLDDDMIERLNFTHITACSVADWTGVWVRYEAGENSYGVIGAAIRLFC